MSLSADDVRAIAEGVVDVLTERGLVGAAHVRRDLDAGEVAALLGTSVRWVYENKDDLGAYRIGQGRQSRLRFDLASIERWKREQAIAPPAPARQRPHGRRARPTGDAHDLLPVHG